MTNLKYTVMTFDRRGPMGMGSPAQGEWFYYEVGTNNTITLTGYRCGTEADVKRAINAILDRLNHDNPEAVPATSTALRLIFPTATTHEDEEGNVTEEEEEEQSTNAQENDE
ncbi:hypothetical protein CCP3SC5AM1_460012 [Gammaproteobacteria bacterium]